MHLGDLSAGMLPAIAIVGGGIPLAAGYALGLQYLKTNNIVACFFGVVLAHPSALTLGMGSHFGRRWTDFLLHG